MSSDPRCEPKVLIGDEHYRLIRGRKEHYLDAPKYLLEVRELDGLGRSSWRPAGLDQQTFLWMKTNLGDILHEAQSTVGGPTQLDSGSYRGQCGRPDCLCNKL